MLRNSCKQTSSASISCIYVFGCSGSLSKNTINDLIESNFKNSNLFEADFTGANILNANFEGANLNNAIWIDGKKCNLGSIGQCK